MTENLESLNTKYGIWNFGETVVKRTLNYLGNHNENNFHMISGFTSELTDELLVALSNNDSVNFIEELGDANWFVTGLLITNGYFNDLYKEKIEVSDNIVLNLGFDWNNEDHLKSLKPEKRSDILNQVLFLTYKNIGAVNTIFKNIMIKNTPKYNGKVLTEEEIVDYILQVNICINTLAIFSGKTIFEIREVNDKKLLARYNGGTFTPELSNNRDTDTERKIIQETLNN